VAENPEDIGLFEAVHTQRSIRRFTDRPVPEEAVARVLEAATRAPSPTNAQPWKFVVVREAERRRAVADVYRRAWEMAKQFYGDPENAAEETERRMLVATDRLAEKLDEAPVFIFCCLDRSRLGPMVTPDLAQLLDPSSAYGAVWAAIQNLALAARALGLAATPTTVHRLFEPEIRDLLALPPYVETVALVVMGYPRGEFGPTQRLPLAEIAFAERWDEPLLTE
jgi:nitroreductase